MMRSLPLDGPHLDDPLYSQKNPYQVFLLVFVLVAVGPTLWGDASPSQTMQIEVSPLALLLWSWCLVVGTAIALVGEWWRGHTWNSLAIEGAGLTLVGVPGLIFAWVVWRSDIMDSTYVVSVTAAFATASLWRVIQIVRRLHWIRSIVDEMNRRANPHE